tara:strand:+ start:185 stop:349 length:165 start_codon:yes stop_codon:yes gene_type:complete
MDKQASTKHKDLVKAADGDYKFLSYIKRWLDAHQKKKVYTVADVNFAKKQILGS